MKRINRTGIHTGQKRLDEWLGKGHYWGLQFNARKTESSRRRVPHYNSAV